jgi:glucose-6-phosphate 1-dehydrogenase
MSRRIRTSRLTSRCGSRSTIGAGPACRSMSIPQANGAATTEIAIRFKQAPYSAFQDTPVDSLRPNWLVLGIAPSQGISLQFEVKRPGSVLDVVAVKMDFRYEDWFPKEPNVGYETLIHDVMIGDQTLFMRADMVEQAWRTVQPLLDAWTTEKAGVPNYDSGGDGPAAADELLARDGERISRPVTTSLEQTS